MGSKQAAPQQTDGQAPAIDSKLVDKLAGRMRDSLLPGDDPMDKDRLHEAARFVLEAGAAREMNRSAIESLSEERRFMRIAIVNDDMPFLVDSTAAAIAAAGLSIDRLVHPVVPVEQEDGGQIGSGVPGGAEQPGLRSWSPPGELDAVHCAAVPRTSVRDTGGLDADLGAHAEEPARTVAKGRPWTVRQLMCSHV